VIGNAKLGRTGVAANLRKGQLVVTVGESQAFGGEITGSFGIANATAGVDLKSQMQFADVDLQSCLGELFGIRNLEGKGNLNVALEGSGSSVMGVTSTLNGTATLTADEGALTGFNIEQLLRRLIGRPLSGTGGLRSGRTPYNKLTATFKVVEGTASIDELRIDGPTVKVALDGSASIPTREVDLKGTASLVPAAGDAATAFELPFVVQGPWDDFIIIPDAPTLERRSSAVGHLLDAIKDRKTRDAVTSTLDRVTGGGARPAPPTSDGQSAQPQ
jgi:AsmA protein